MEVMLYIAGGLAIVLLAALTVGIIAEVYGVIRRVRNG